MSSERRGRRPRVAGERPLTGVVDSRAARRALSRRLAGDFRTLGGIPPAGPLAARVVVDGKLQHQPVSKGEHWAISRAPGQPEWAPDLLIRGKRTWAHRARSTAVERWALYKAVQHYLGLGATSVEVRGKPFDLVVVLDGVERHIEVKGATGQASAVNLTVNEIGHARSREAMDLVVVDRITVKGKRQHSASGGRLRVFSDWTPSEVDLTPLTYRYTLPRDD